MGKEVAAEKAREVGVEIRQFVAQLRQKVYGGQACPDWGTLFSEIEELGVQIGDAVCREFAQQSVSQQAQIRVECDQEHQCPTCDGPLECRGAEPKLLLTRRGEIAWQEPQTYCPKCRKAFFPSVQESGNSG
jgi:hypothetical protein